MYVGYFDYVVLVLLVGINVAHTRHSGSGSLGCWYWVAAALLFCIVLPIISIWGELERTRRPPGVIVDSFELLYTYFRFPMYWALFLVQLGLLLIRNRLKKQQFQPKYKLDL